MTRAPRLHAIRPFTMRIVNPVTRRFAGWLPGFGLLTHVGRTSGRAYTTPINVFRRGRHHLFALTYGSDVQWVKNVLAAGGCTLRTRGADVPARGSRADHRPVAPIAAAARAAVPAADAGDRGAPPPGGRRPHGLIGRPDRRATPCIGCEDARMVEYGNGVGQATGISGGGGGGGTTDLGAGAAAFVNDAVNTISALPPTTLVIIAVLIFVGLIILRRAF